jgi:hypothetical protein
MIIIESLLPQIKKINDKYPKIDWGGCGTFSYHLSEKLNKLNIKNQIVYTPEKETPEGAYRCDIKFHHIFVKVDNYLIDNYGINSFEKEVLSLENEKLKLMLEDKKLWNNVFPHEKWDPLAKDIMNIKL